MWTLALLRDPQVQTLFTNYLAARLKTLNRPKLPAQTTNLAALAMSTTYSTPPSFTLPKDDPLTRLTTQFCGQGLSCDFALQGVDHALLRCALPTLMLEWAVSGADAGGIVAPYVGDSRAAQAAAAAGASMVCVTGSGASGGSNGSNGSSSSSASASAIASASGSTHTDLVTSIQADAMALDEAVRRRSTVAVGTKDVAGVVRRALESEADKGDKGDKDEKDEKADKGEEFSRIKRRSEGEKGEKGEKGEESSRINRRRRLLEALARKMLDTK
jgi:hypothetical protein